MNDTTFMPADID